MEKSFKTLYFSYASYYKLASPRLLSELDSAKIVRQFIQLYDNCMIMRIDA